MVSCDAFQRPRMPVMSVGAFQEAPVLSRGGCAKMACNMPLHKKRADVAERCAPFPGFSPLLLQLHSAWIVPCLRTLEDSAGFLACRRKREGWVPPRWNGLLLVRLSSLSL